MFGFQLGESEADKCLRPPQGEAIQSPYFVLSTPHPKMKETEGDGVGSAALSNTRPPCFLPLDLGGGMVGGGRGESGGKKNERLSESPGFFLFCL